MRVTRHENKEWCKVWTGIDWSVKLDVKNLTNFDPTNHYSEKFALKLAAFDQNMQCLS